MQSKDRHVEGCVSDVRNKVGVAHLSLFNNLDQMLSGAQKANKNNAAFRHQHKIQIRVSELPRLSVY